jgi:hypothetical protein
MEKSMMTSTANYRRAILDAYAGKDPGMIVWQPRIDFWYSVNQTRGTLPEQVREMSLLDLYDYCQASIRYFLTAPLRVTYKNVQVTEQVVDESHLRRTWETPLGALSEALHYDEYHLSAYNSEYRLKTAQDFKIYAYILQDETWHWDQESYARDVAAVGERGVPQFYFRRSPIQGLFIENLGFEKTIYLMADQPEVVAQYVEVASAADDALYAVLVKAPTPILNFGENIDAHMDPPRIWRDHLLPYYTRRNAQLLASGKYTHIHIDGAMRPLIRQIRESPFTAIEACTPLPQGDVTLEEIKQALGDKVLLDGIPAVYFLPSFPIEELIACVKQVVELFYPHLVLGISDELPPDSDIERVRMVGEMVQEMI